MEISQEQVSKVLSEIGSRVPKNLLKSAFTEVEVTPTVLFVMKKALESKTISDEKKKKIQALLDSGDFSKKKIRENPKILKMIDNFYGREINKAKREGRLPKNAQELPDFNHFMKNAKQKIHSEEDKGAHRDK